MLHSELVQICWRFRFGSGLGQVWFMSCGRAGSFRHGRLARQTWNPHVGRVRCVCAVRLHVTYMLQMKFDEFRLAVG